MFNILLNEVSKIFLGSIKVKITLFIFVRFLKKYRKKDTIMRTALPAKLELQVACRYLATGDSLASLQYLYRVPKCTISKFLPDVFDAIYEALQDLSR